MGAAAAPKQLVPVGGVPLLYRTVSQLRLRGRVIVRVVAPATAVWQATARTLNADLMPPEAALFLAALPPTLIAAPGCETHLVLCGDVVWSDDMLDRLLASPAPVSFAGRFVPNVHTGRAAGELYGFAVREYFDGVRGGVHRFCDRVKAVLRTLDELRPHLAHLEPDQIDAVLERNGRLWQLLHALEDEGAARVIEAAWDDYIDDIDGPDDLARLPQIEAAIAALEALI